MKWDRLLKRSLAESGVIPPGVVIGDVYLSYGSGLVAVVEMKYGHKDCSGPIFLRLSYKQSILFSS